MTDTVTQPVAEAPAADLKLSTAPAEVGPPPDRGDRAAGPGGPRRRPFAPLIRYWRLLTSMRTALLLLFLLALAAVPGSLLPQRSLNPLAVQQFQQAHRTWAPIIDRLSGFDVFAAPWFAAIYLLLFISLIGCLVPRIRLHARALIRKPPATPARPSRLPHGGRWTTTATPAEVVEAGRAVLRGKRFRVAADPAARSATLSAEKGYLRETGNLVFHVALVVLLAGIALGSAFGYQGSVLVVQGDGFSNTLVSYDQFKAGRLIDTAKLSPFSLALDTMTSTWRSNGEAQDFNADVTYSKKPNGPTATADIHPNHPLVLGSASVYLIGHGYAPHFVLKDKTGAVVWDAYVPCTPRDANFTSTCTVKIGDAGLPDTGSPKTPQQLAFTGVMTPTTQLDAAQGFVSTFPGLKAPGMTITGYVGNLHIDDGAPQNVYELDRTNLTQLKLTGPIGKDQTAQVLAIDNPAQRTVTGLPDGMSLSVDGVHEFATFQVKSDPYKLLVLVAAAFIVAGLLGSLRVRRRRLWLRATPSEDGRTLVEMGGLARTDPDTFATEFGRLAREVHARTHRPPPQTPEQQE